MEYVSENHPLNLPNPFLSGKYQQAIDLFLMASCWQHSCSDEDGVQFGLEDSSMEQIYTPTLWGRYLIFHPIITEEDIETQRG